MRIKYQKKKERKKEIPFKETVIGVYLQFLVVHLHFNIFNLFIWIIDNERSWQDLTFNNEIDKGLKHFIPKELFAQYFTAKG